MEYLTDRLAKRAWTLIQEVEELGGMAKAIEKGVPKMRIEAAAARKQARIDSAQDKIVGVNIFKPEEELDIELLEVDNTAVRNAQIKRLEEVKAKRDNAAVQSRFGTFDRSCTIGGRKYIEHCSRSSSIASNFGRNFFCFRKTFWTICCQ